MSFESNEGSRNFEGESSGASEVDIYGSSTSGVEQSILPPERSRGSLNNPQSTVLTMDLHTRNSPEGNQSTISPESSEGVSTLEAQASEAAIETVGDSKSNLPSSKVSGSAEGKINPKQSEDLNVDQDKDKSLYSGHCEATRENEGDSKSMLLSCTVSGSGDGKINLKQSEDLNVDQDEDKSLYSGHCKASRENEGDSESILPYSKVSGTGESNIATKRREDLNIDSYQDEDKSLYSRQCEATIRNDGDSESMLPSSEVSGSGEGKNSPNRLEDLNIDSDKGEDQRLYSGRCCGHCAKPLNRYERVAHVFEIKCMRPISNDESEAVFDEDIVIDDDGSQYLVHRCNTPKHITPSGEKIRCYLCSERFGCVLMFECHVKLQHQVNAMALCQRCKMYRSIVDFYFRNFSQ